MHELIFQLRRYYMKPMSFVSRHWWNLKLDILCKYYGGGKNIPPAVLAKWCPIVHDNIERACIGACLPVVRLGQFLGIPLEQDIAMAYFNGFVYNNAKTYYELKVGRRIALSVRPAKQYFRCLYMQGHYQRKIKFVLSQPEKLEEFRKLIEEPNEHLTLSISV